MTLSSAMAGKALREARIVTASSYISTLTVSEGIATRGTYQALDTQRWIFEPA